MNSQTFGASLSIKQCRNFGINDQEVLKSAINDLGLKRFRLMSYWDECEKIQGKYDFKILDAQVRTIARAEGEITLCLGARQPRWPESHWPIWTRKLSKIKRNQALINFITRVVDRYKNNPAVISWQLENEALLKNFGEHGDFDRKRLRLEFALVKNLDPNRPIIMTTSTSWGFPLRRPIPDIVGFSYYRITHDKNAYRKSVYQPWIFTLRTIVIEFLWHRPCFIHELQAEPWGPKNIWEMSRKEQDKSMSLSILKKNISAARITKLRPIDMWGLEWWFWLNKNGEPKFWKFIKTEITK